MFFYIKFTKKMGRVKERINNNLSWYDNIKKKIINFEGGKLSYVYKKDSYLEKMGYDNPYRLLPEVVDDYGYKNGLVSDEEKVVKFLNDYPNYSNSNVDILNLDKNGVSFYIDDESCNDFILDLEREGFDFYVKS